MAFTPGMERTLAVKVESDGVGGFTGAMDSAIDSLGKFKYAVGLAGGALAAFGTGALAAATNAAADFEQAMVEVEKVTNPEVASAMSGEIMEMARTIPLAQSELAALTADAARFGITGPENLRTFTETVAKMATATDLGAQQAGESLARLATLTNTPVDKIENLGSSVNELSNNFATSSSEIIDSMMRSSAALSQLGVSNTEIVGLSAALNEVSESSERAGTRLRRVGQEMMNPKKTEDLAAALGMTTEEFRSMRENDPSKLIMQMASTMKEGGEQADALRSTLTTTSRQALGGLSQNLDGAREALGMANQSFEEGTSLQKEFDAATDTFNSKLTILKNLLRENAVAIGNVLLPPLTRALESVNDFLTSSDSLINKLTAQQKAFGLAASAVGGLVLAVGMLISGPLGLAIGAVAALGTAYATNFMGMRGHVNALVTDLRAVFLPAMQQLSKGVRTALTGMRALWSRNRKAVIADVSALFGGIQTVATAGLQFYEDLYRTTLKRVEAFWAANRKRITKTVRNLFAIVQMVTRQSLGMLFTLWQTHSGKVFATVRNYVNLVQTTFFGLATTLLQIITPLLTRLRSFWQQHGKDIMFIVRTLAGVVITVVTALANTLMGIFRWFFGIAAKAWNLFGDEIVAVVELAADVIFSTLGWLLDGLVTLIKTTTAVMEGDWKRAWNLIAGFFERTLRGVYRFAANWGSRFLGWLGGLLDGAIQAFKDFGNWLIFGSYIPEMFGKVLGFLGNVDLAGAIMAPLDAFKGAISGAVDTVVSTFEGALSTVESIAGSIMSSANDAVDAASSALSKAKSMASDAASAASNAASSAASAASDAASAAGDVAGDVAGGVSDAVPGLASGGIVTAPTLAMVGEGGESEAVIPLSKLDQMTGGGGPQIGRVVVRANSRAEGEAAAMGFTDELRSHGFRW